MSIINPKRYALPLAIAMGIAVGSPICGAVDSYTFLRYTSFNPQKTTENARPVNGNQVPSFTLVAFGYGPFGPAIEVRSTIQTAESGVLLTSVPLVYPNPMRISQGATLGYRLSRNVQVEMRIFDIRGNQVFRTEYPAGAAGGLEGYNRRIIDRFTFSDHDLSSGVYFIVLIAEGRVIGKTKMVVTP